MKRVIFMAFLILFATSFSAMAVEMAEVGGPNPDVPSFVGYAPNRIVVKFDPSILPGMDKAAMARGRTGIPVLDQVGTWHGVRSLRPQFPGAKKKSYKGKVIDLSGWHEVEFAGRADILAAVAEYKAVPGVLDAQPVGIHKVNKEPNDWNYVNAPYQWHLPRIQAPQAWDFETGNPAIIVAVMDTGVRYFHRDLGGANASFSNPAAAEGNMWINTAERYGIEGVDDDGNGRVDDWIGWDFVHVLDNWPLMQCFPGEDCLAPDNDPRDFHGHGTHCAGNVATMNNNSYSQSSVAGGWGNGNFVGGPGTGVKVMDLRIGWSAIYGILFEVGMVDMGFAAQALHYAADKGARIASCSWGSDNSGGIGEASTTFWQAEVLSSRQPAMTVRKPRITCALATMSSALPQPIRTTARQAFPHTGAGSTFPLPVSGSGRPGTTVMIPYLTIFPRWTARRWRPRFRPPWRRSSGRRTPHGRRPR